MLGLGGKVSYLRHKIRRIYIFINVHSNNYKCLCIVAKFFPGWLENVFFPISERVSFLMLPMSYIFI